jgi:hypothetical protein
MNLSVRMCESESDDSWQLLGVQDLSGQIFDKLQDVT